MAAIRLSFPAMKDLYGLNQPTIAVSYPQLLVEIVNERGFALEALLDGVRLKEEVLHRPEARISPLQWGQMIVNALKLTGDPGLGYEFGLRMRPSSHGFMGYALMSCDSMRQAMELAARYFQARQRNFIMRLDIDGGDGVIEVREKHPIPVLRSFYYENIMIGLARGAAAILGLEVTQFAEAEIWFDWPQPSYHAAYAARLPRIRFGQSANVLRFPLSLLDRRPVLADPHASRQAIALCERELAQAGSGEDPIGLRVCAELVMEEQGGYPSQEAVAARLHLSSRSLARKLQASGSSYQSLLEEARRRDACELIERDGVDLQTVASRLGYTNPANFTRAFRRWTGESPSQYRNRVLKIV